MSKYTTELRWIIDMVGKGSFPENPTIMQKITTAAPLIFNFDFPIWEESDRIPLEVTILRHYYLREIAFETFELWRFFLMQSMAEIMPKYVKLWETTQNEYNYLEPYFVNETFHRGLADDMDFHNAENGSQTQDTDSSSSTTGEGNSLSSDLPQATTSTNIDYANMLAQDSSSTTTNGKSSASGSNTRDTTGEQNRNVKENYTRDKKGNLGNKTITELIVEYRDALLLIPPLIVQDLADLFFTLY